MKPTLLLCWNAGRMAILLECGMAEALGHRMLGLLKYYFS